MADTDFPDSMEIPDGSKWDQRLVFKVFVEGARRKLLATIARKGPSTAADLMHLCHKRGKGATKNQRMDVTLKHLAVIVEAGILVQLPNERDGRKPLYALSPDVVVRISNDRVIFDFGFLASRE